MLSRPKVTIITRPKRCFLFLGGNEPRCSVQIEATDVRSKRVAKLSKMGRRCPPLSVTLMLGAVEQSASVSPDQPPQPQPMLDVNTTVCRYNHLNLALNRGLNHSLGRLLQTGLQLRPLRTLALTSSARFGQRMMRATSPRRSIHLLLYNLVAQSVATVDHQ